MGEPYSDEKLLAYVDEQGDAACGHYVDLGRMIRRLRAERDEARFTARELAYAINRREPCEYGPTCAVGVCPEVRRALAYGFPYPALPYAGGTRHGV